MSCSLCQSHACLDILALATLPLIDLLEVCFRGEAGFRAACERPCCLGAAADVTLAYKLFCGTLIAAARFSVGLLEFCAKLYGLEGRGEPLT